ncbi:toll/interleukin-1 receptor domain-containing protein [Streptomyces torulosus]|uniref:toll/interleukin-1 receptor domain-containing protein n=1 Tax=Streptomyces torulosus TaxID=68276 RepID=UPI0006EB5FDE|nr:toll/interleukin-1 receptor domain-containing protein [Streptomyces torulosus]
MESSYDVFASYRRQDGQAVQTIATRLRDQGLKVWFDRWSLTPGLPWQPAIETAVAQCRTIAVFIGPPGIGGWQEREMRQALDRQVQDSDLRVIPVLLPGATPPEGFIAANTWVQFDDLADEESFQYLVDGVLGRAPDARTTLHEVRVAENFPLLELCALVGCDFIYLSFLAPHKENPQFSGNFYGVRIRLLENLGKLEVSQDSINLLRRQLDTDEALAEMHRTRLAIRDDLSVRHSTMIVQAFEAGHALKGLSQLIDLYQARGEGINEEECALVLAYVNATADHTERSSPTLFPGLVETDVPRWRDTLTGPLDQAELLSLQGSVNEPLGRFLTKYGIHLQNPEGRN